MVAENRSVVTRATFEFGVIRRLVPARLRPVLQSVKLERRDACVKNPTSLTGRFPRTRLPLQSSHLQKSLLLRKEDGRP